MKKFFFTIEFKKDEIEYINSFLATHRCKIDLLTEEQKKKKPFKKYIKLMNDIERKLSV